MGKVDWKEVEASLLGKSDQVSITRLNSADISEDFKKELEKYGLGVPAEQTVTLEQPVGVEGDLLNLQIEDVYKTLSLVSEIRHLQRGYIDVQRMSNADPAISSGFALRVQDEFLKQLDDKNSKLSQLTKESPDAFLATCSNAIRMWRRQMEEGRIAHTESVMKSIDSIVNHLSHGNVVLLHGETGTGKTEVARVAAKAFTGQDGILVRGYSGMGSEELFGHMTLASSGMANSHLIESRLAEYRRHTQNQGDSTAESEFVSRLLSNNGVTVSEYVLGSVYRAAKDGKVVILDEANYIPPPLLAKLNDILTKRPGEMIHVQEDGIGPIEVKKGFGIILTGNINGGGRDQLRYKNRHDFDLAFLDRIKILGYNYLPQAIEGSYKEHSAKDKELFQVAVTSLLASPLHQRGLVSSIPREVRVQERWENRHGALYLPDGEKSLKDIWRLCKMAAVAQRAFSGEIKDGDPNGFLDRGVSVGYRPQITLSTRVVMSIMKDWKDDGFKYELDYYVGQAVLSRAISLNDRTFFYQLGEKFGFFNSEPWGKAKHSASSINFEVPKLAQIGAPEFVSGATVVEALFGAIPSRQNWPQQGQQAQKLDSQNKAAAVLTKIAELNALRDEVKKLNIRGISPDNK